MFMENQFLLWAIVGTASGLILGIAGTGGGVISIPILMSLGGYDIKRASGYGLLALTVGAAISWFIQRKNTHYPIAVVLVVCAGVIAFASAPLKAFTPPWAISLLLNLTCLFGLYSLWVLRKPEDPGEDRPISFQLKTGVIGGMITGFLSTMTGLGGGVFIIPWLTGITRLRFDRAIACSLLTVALTAPFAAWRQDTIDLAWPEWCALISMIVLMSLLTRKITGYIKTPHLILIRKLTLTAVIFVSMMRTLPIVFEYWKL